MGSSASKGPAPQSAVRTARCEEEQKGIRGTAWKKRDLELHPDGSLLLRSATSGTLRRLQPRDGQVSAVSAVRAGRPVLQVTAGKKTVVLAFEDEQAAAEWHRVLDKGRRVPAGEDASGDKAADAKEPAAGATDPKEPVADPKESVDKAADPKAAGDKAADPKAAGDKAADPSDKAADAKEPAAGAPDPKDPVVEKAPDPSDKAADAKTPKDPKIEIKEDGDKAAPPKDDPVAGGQDTTPFLPAQSARVDQLRRGVRMFISSTFRDHMDQRDLIMRLICPQIRAELARRNNPLVFVEVDLRWGISEDQTERALEICLGEVDRCRPFYLLMLGDRYGYVPDEYGCAQFDFVRDVPPGLSMTHMEALYAVLREPADQPRTPPALVYIRSTPLPDVDDPALLRNHNTPSDDHRAKQAALKDQLRAHRGCIVRDYECAYEVNAAKDDLRVTQLDAFGQMVLRDVLAAVEAFQPDGPPPDPRDLEAREQELQDRHHADFCESRASHFRGRVELVDKVLDAISDASLSPSGELPILLTGPSGAGKTSLLAKCAALGPQRLQEDHGRAPLIITHFVGATNSAAESRMALLRLATKLADYFEVPAPDKNTSYEELRDTTLPSIAAVMHTQRRGPVAIFLDGVDTWQGAGNRARTLEWLPAELPAQTAMLLSMAHGPELEVVRARRPKPREIYVGDLTRRDSVEIVSATMAEYRKTLLPKQVDTLVAHHEATRPLYLIVAVEELRLHGVFESLNQRLADLPNTVHDLLDGLLERTEHDHGLNLVKLALSLIASARGGILEEEMLALLPTGLASLDAGASFVSTQWFFLRSSLAIYLRAVTDASIDFVFTQLFNVVRRRYLLDDTAFARSVHRVLAQYHADTGDPSGDASWTGGSRRAISEAAYHAVCASDAALIKRSLQSLPYMAEKCANQLTYDLVEDYILASNVDAVQPYSEFLRHQAHVFARTPELVLQQALNYFDASPVAQQAREPAVRAILEEKANAAGLKFLSWRNPPLEEASPIMMTMYGHTDYVDHLFFVNKDKLLVSASARALKAWDPRTGREVATLAAQRGTFISTACSAAPDSSLIFVAMTRHAEDRGGLEGDGFLSPILSPVLARSRSPARAKSPARIPKSPRRSRSRSRSPSARPKLTVERSQSPPRLSRTASLSSIATFTPTELVEAGYMSAESEVLLVDASTGAIVDVVPVPDNDRTQATVYMQALKRHQSFAALVRTMREGPKSGRVKVWQLGGRDERSDVREQLLIDREGTSFCASRDGSKLLIFSQGTASLYLSERGWDCAATYSIGVEEMVVTSYSTDFDEVVVCGRNGQVVAMPMEPATPVPLSRPGRKKGGKGGEVMVQPFCELLPGMTKNKFFQAAFARQWAALFSYTETDIYLFERKGDLVWEPCGSLDGHIRGVASCAFFADGTDRLVSGSQDKTLRLWDLKTKECLSVVHEHSGQITQCLSTRNPTAPDKAVWTLSTGRDKLVRVMDTGRAIKVPERVGHIDHVTSVAFDGTGKHLLSTSVDGTAWLDGEKIHTQSNRVTQGVIDGKFMLLSTASKDAVLYPINTTLKDQALQRLTDHRGWVTGCAFGPTPERAVTSCRDGVVRIFNIGDRGRHKPTPALAESEAMETHVSSIVVSRERQRLLGAVTGNVVVEWDAETLKSANTLSLGDEPMAFKSAIYSPGEATTVAAVANQMRKSLTLWDLRTGECVLSPLAGNEVGSVAFVDEHVMVVGVISKRLYAIDRRRADQPVGIFPLRGGGSAVAVAPGGGEVVVGDFSGRLYRIGIE